MNIKVTPKAQNAEWKFPRLGMSKNNKTIILFSSKSVGIVLVSGHSSEKLFQSNNDWNMDYFEPFDGAITLSNE